MRIFYPNEIKKLKILNVSLNFSFVVIVIVFVCLPSKVNASTKFNGNGMANALNKDVRTSQPIPQNANPTGSIHLKNANYFKNQPVLVEVQSKKEAISDTTTISASYGNAIVIKENEISKGDTGEAFVLPDNNDKPAILAISGDPSDNSPINPQFKDKNSIEINHYQMTNVNECLLSNENNISFGITGKGNMLKQDFLSQWGTKRVLPVNYGDIIQIKVGGMNVGHTKNSLYIPLNQSNNPDEIFFEITKKGFEPLNINQLNFKKITIPYGTSHKDLDIKVKETIETKENLNMSIEKFTKYPDTTKSGNQSAKVLVSEELSTGKKVELEYDVPIYVEQDGSLMFKSIPTDVFFGEMQLGSENSILYWQGLNDVIVSDERKIADGWTLQIHLIDMLNADFTNYLYWVSEKDFSKITLENSAPTIYESLNKGDTNITNTWNKNHTGVMIDYSNVETIRSDSAILEWTLLPTNKDINP